MSAMIQKFSSNPVLRCNVCNVTNPKPQSTLFMTYQKTGRTSRIGGLRARRIRMALVVILGCCRLTHGTHIGPLFAPQPVWAHDPQVQDMQEMHQFKQCCLLNLFMNLHIIGLLVWVCMNIGYPIQSYGL